MAQSMPKPLREFPGLWWMYCGVQRHRVYFYWLISDIRFRSTLILFMISFCPGLIPI